MRACWYRIRDVSAGRVSISEPKSGTWHAWTVDHEEYDNGPGHFAAAIIEDTTSHAVFVVPAQDVSFGTEPVFRNMNLKRTTHE